MARRKGQDLRSVLAARTTLDGMSGDKNAPLVPTTAPPLRLTTKDNQPPASTLSREELVRRASQVRRAKQRLLDDLNDEQRHKLVAIALKTLLNEG